MATSILGLEGTHSWNGVLVLNARSTYPRYKLDEIGGLYSLPDAEDKRDLPIGHHGELPRRALRRGKTITYKGEVQATSLSSLRDASAAASAAFYDLAEGTMTVAPVGAYSGPTRFYKARALDYECPEEQTKGPQAGAFHGFSRPFALALRMSDARYYDPTVTTTVDTGAVSGGISAATFTMPGTGPTDPVIDIYGPINNPILENITTGKELNFDRVGGLILTDVQFVRVNFVTRQVLFAGTTDYSSKLNLATSDWWNADAHGLIAASNTIQLRGASISPGAHAHIVATPAYL